MPATDALPQHDGRSSAEELLLLARAGDESATARLIAGVAPFIRRIAKKYSRKVPAADLDDLQQAGRIAAGQAIESYNPDLGTAWHNYAMTAAARGVAREATKAKRLASRFPTPDEGTEVDCSALPVAEPSWDPTESGPVWSMQDALVELDPLDRAVVERVYGLDGVRIHERHEIAAALGIQSRRIPAIVSRAHARLRQILEERGFGDGVHGKA